MYRPLPIHFGLVAIAIGIASCSWLTGAKVAGPGGVGIELDGPDPPPASSTTVATTVKDSHTRSLTDKRTITYVTNYYGCPSDAGADGG